MGAAQPSPEELAALWARWHQDRDESARERIVLHYYPLCKKVAGAMARGMPPHVDKDELNSWATMGLFRAVEHFDPQAGVTFPTYGIAAMKSVIMDGVRRADWAPRSLRKRQRRLECSESEITQACGRRATDAEIADDLGWSEEQVRATRLEVEASWHTSLEQEAAEVGCEDDGEAALDTDHIRAALVAAFTTLPFLERAMVALVHFEQMRVGEAAKVLGVRSSTANAALEHGCVAVLEKMREAALA